MAFTGHERDDNGVGTTDDLDYMHARYYSALNGRFLSVDPGASARLGQPQSWNKYSYALGNPLRYVDPDGRQSVSPPVNVPTSPGGVFDQFIAFLRKYYAENVMMDNDGSRKIEEVLYGTVALAATITTFDDIFQAGVPQEDGKDIRVVEGSEEDAKQQFYDATDPGSRDEKGDGVVTGTDKKTRRVLIYRERSTDSDAAATIEEQRKTESGRTRSRKVRFYDNDRRFDKPIEPTRPK
jgi:RHS repeat-associated protein